MNIFPILGVKCVLKLGEGTRLTQGGKLADLFSSNFSHSTKNP